MISLLKNQFLWLDFILFFIRHKGAFRVLTASEFLSGSCGRIRPNFCHFWDNFRQAQDFLRHLGRFETFRDILRQFFERFRGILADFCRF